MKISGGCNKLYGLCKIGFNPKPSFGMEFNSGNLLNVLSNGAIKIRIIDNINGKKPKIAEAMYLYLL